MSGERLARIALALDAMYCAALGLVAIVLRARLGGLLRLPGALVFTAGAAAAGWAYLVLGQTVRIDWRAGIKQVLVANAVASVLLAVAAACHPARGARLLLAFLSLDVMSFAVLQGLSLTDRRRRSGAGE
jgi:ABC-type cobalamin transport system permease subunit